MSDIREKIVRQVEATGEYIKKHADEIVDRADMRTGFDISVAFDPEYMMPEISIKQSHVIVEGLI